jgi:hypothetical protein
LLPPEPIVVLVAALVGLVVFPLSIHLQQWAVLRRMSPLSGLDAAGATTTVFRR